MSRNGAWPPRVNPFNGIGRASSALSALVRFFCDTSSSSSSDEEESSVPGATGVAWGGSEGAGASGEGREDSSNARAA